MDCGEEDKATKAEGTRAGFGIVRQNQAKPTNKITRRCGSIQLMKACNCERTEAILLIQIASSALPPPLDFSQVSVVRSFLVSFIPKAHQQGLNKPNDSSKKNLDCESGPSLGVDKAR